MQEILQQVAQGLGGLAMAHDTRQTALRHLEQWLTEPAFASYRPQLTWLIAQRAVSLTRQFLPRAALWHRWATCVLSVSARIALMPGPWPPPCRCAVLAGRYPQQDIAVVIAYDVRVFNDLRGLYARDLPNPCSG